MKYRVVFDPNFMGDYDPFTSEPLQSKEAAEDVLLAMATYTLYLHETSLMPDYSNTGHIERCVGTEEVWEEVEDE